jgi:hypothetical protein
MHSKFMYFFLFFLNYTNDMDFFEQVQSFNESREDIVLQMNYTQDRLSEKTARFAAGYDAVCLFVNDIADAEALSVLSMCGVRRNILVSDAKVLYSVIHSDFHHCMFPSFQVKLVAM